MSDNENEKKYDIDTKISDELANFLGKEIGLKYLIIDICKEIYKYIKDNNLQDPINGRNINFNDELKDLFKLEDNTALTYFNLHIFVKKHYR